MKPVKFRHKFRSPCSSPIRRRKTVDDVVNNNSHITAMGGKENWESLECIPHDGSMSTQGVDISMTMTRSHLIGFRLDMDIMVPSNHQMLNATEGCIYAGQRYD